MTTIKIRDEGDVKLKETAQRALCDAYIIALTICQNWLKGLACQQIYRVSSAALKSAAPDQTVPP